MKFKTYIQEQHTNIINESSYYRELAEMFSYGRIPITSKVSKLLGYTNKMVEVQHCTSIEYIKKLKQIQGTNNHVSTFTHDLSNLINNITVRPELMFILKGNSVIDFEHDIFSHPDKNGRRWLGTTNHSKSLFLRESLLLKCSREIIKILQLDIDAYDLVYDPMKLQKAFLELSKKDQDNIIQMYVDKVHNLMSKSIFTKIVKEILLVNKDNLKYNEIILNNFKIKGCYALETGKFQFNHDEAENIVTEHGIKYLGFIPISDFKKY